MESQLKLVPFRPEPSLLDIPGQLRQLADAIERGDHKPEAAFMLLTEPDTFKPTFFGWGRVPDRHGVAGLFMHCAQLALIDRDDAQ